MPNKAKDCYNGGNPLFKRLPNKSYLVGLSATEIEQYIDSCLGNLTIADNKLHMAFVSKIRSFLSSFCREFYKNNSTYETTQRFVSNCKIQSQELQALIASIIACIKDGISVYQHSDIHGTQRYFIIVGTEQRAIIDRKGRYPKGYSSLFKLVETCVQYYNDYLDIDRIDELIICLTIIQSVSKVFDNVRPGLDVRHEIRKEFMDIVINGKDQIYNNPNVDADECRRWVKNQIDKLASLIDKLRSINMKGCDKKAKVLYRRYSSLIRMKDYADKRLSLAWDPKIDEFYSSSSSNCHVRFKLPNGKWSDRYSLSGIQSIDFLYGNAITEKDNQLFGAAYEFLCSIGATEKEYIDLNELDDWQCFDSMANNIGIEQHKFKLRFITIINSMIQRAMQYFHNRIAEVLGQLIEDCTKNQDKGKEFARKLSADFRYSNASFDLKRCTDTMDLELQYYAIRKFVFFNQPELADKWYEIMKNLSFTIDGKNDLTYTFFDGQAQGILSSFPSFTLLHHLLMYISYTLLNDSTDRRPIYDRYRILGDDNVSSFKDTRMLTLYPLVMSYANVQTNDVKAGFHYIANSEQMENVIEFAKVTYNNGALASGAPAELLRQSVNSISQRLALIRYWNSNGVIAIPSYFSDEYHQEVWQFDKEYTLFPKVHIRKLLENFTYERPIDRIKYYNHLSKLFGLSIVDEYLPRTEGEIIRIMTILPDYLGGLHHFNNDSFDNLIFLEDNEVKNRAFTKAYLMIKMISLGYTFCMSKHQNSISNEYDIDFWERRFLYFTNRNSIVNKKIAEVTSALGDKSIFNKLIRQDSIIQFIKDNIYGGDTNELYDSIIKSGSDVALDHIIELMDGIETANDIIMTLSIESSYYGLQEIQVVKNINTGLETHKIRKNKSRIIDDACYIILAYMYNWCNWDVRSFVCFIDHLDDDVCADDTPLEVSMLPGYNPEFLDLPLIFD